jgi:glycine oxidase
LKLQNIINTSIFILPLGKDLYKIGATYNWYDKSSTPTEEGKAELVLKLNEVITCEYTIVEHQAGIRPTVKDRKPIIGTHPQYERLHILNGLGTRGVMLGPFMAKTLYDHIESNKSIPKEIDIKRFPFVSYHS